MTLTFLTTPLNFLGGAIPFFPKVSVPVCGFGKNEFRLFKQSKNFFDWGGGPRGPPLNTPMCETGITH